MQIVLHSVNIFFIYDFIIIYVKHTRHTQNYICTYYKFAIPIIVLYDLDCKFLA